MPQSKLNNPPLFISVFGLGALRPAPGTWGSLPPVAIAAGLYLLGCTPWQSPLIYYVAIIAICVAASIACIMQGPAAEKYYGKKDPSNAVADETAGQCLSLLVFAAPDIPILTFWPMMVTLACAFVLFRICDIIKPWPARGLQRLSAGWGILVDDLIAGVYAAAGTWVFLKYVVQHLPLP